MRWFVNEITNRKHVRKDIKEMMYQNKCWKNLYEIANKFNNYFNPVGDSREEQSISQYKPPTAVKHVNSLFLAPTSKEEITNIIKSLDNKITPENDEITTDLLKN